MFQPGANGEWPEELLTPELRQLYSPDNSTAADYQWLLDRAHRAGHDIYVADFEHLGVDSCRILVPGVSEIHPLDDLESENNSVGNAIREAILHLPELDDEECAELLDTLNDLDVQDQLPVAALIGLAADPDSFWADLRVGELKTLLALAIGDDEAIREACEWVRHFEQLDAGRRLVYRCIEALLDLGSADDHRSSATPVRQRHPGISRGHAARRTTLLRHRGARHGPQSLRSAPATAGGLRQVAALGAGGAGGRVAPRISALTSWV